MCERNRTTNRCYRECPLWDDEAACRKVQEDANCYQCVIATAPGYEKEATALRQRLASVMTLEGLVLKAERLDAQVSVSAFPDRTLAVRVSRNGCSLQHGLTKGQMEKTGEKELFDSYIRAWEELLK